MSDSQRPDHQNRDDQRRAGDRRDRAPGRPGGARGTARPGAHAGEGRRPAGGYRPDRPGARFARKDEHAPSARGIWREGGKEEANSTDKRTYSGNDRPKEWKRFNQSGEKRFGSPEGRERSTAHRGPSGEKRGYPTKNGQFSGKKPAYRGHTGAEGGNRTQQRPERPAWTDGMPARRLALDVIRKVLENGAYASLALDEALHHCTLAAVDRRLAARLVYDTLDRRLYLDHALSQVMAKPDTDPKLVNILRLGACQLLLEDRIPEMAATDTSVRLCKELGMEGLAGVCNGILRNLIRQKDSLSWPDPEAEPLKALSLRLSVPEELAAMLIRDWGRERAEKLMSVTGRDRPLVVRANTLKVSDEEFEALLSKKVWRHERGPLPHTWYLRDALDIGADADFRHGMFCIQSEGSMLACLAADPRRGQRVLDACAAPGGKACMMAELMGDTGRVQAWELHDHRTRLIEAQATRLGLEAVRPMTRDALIHREDLVDAMDVVLLDAPCSGTGDMAEKPDVKYRVSAESVAGLAATQKALLDAVYPYVRPGGTLVYATCSVLKEENERQAEAFLARHPEFELSELPATVPERYRGRPGVGLQLLPDTDGVGFYICRMRRRRV